MHPMVLLDDKAQVEACFSPFRDRVSVSLQDRCTVCAERTTGSEIVLVAPDRTDDVRHVESLFDLFRDSVSVGIR
jgi:hypothetical protein